MPDPKPISLTQAATNTAAGDPQPLVIIGTLPEGGVAAATTTVRGTVKKAAAQATFAGADLAAVKVELNAFYAKLQAAGIVA